MQIKFSFIKRFISYFFIILIPVIIVGYFYFNTRVQRLDISIRKEQEKEVELKVGQLSDYFRFMESQVLTLTMQEHVIEVFSDDPQVKAHARRYTENYFDGMIANSDFFDQVRIVCSSGIEHVRVNNVAGTPVSVNPTDYRDISDRYYFKRAINLQEGEIYISRFDLDPEKQLISYPVKPILRIVAPIIRDTKLYGLFIINIKGHEFFKNLRVIGNDYGWETYFLNQDGNYLMSPEPLKEWLSYKDSVNAVRFQDDFKNIDILESDVVKKTFSNSFGLFTYHRIDNNNFAINNSGKKVMEESWFVVSFIPRAKLQDIRESLFDIKDAIILFSGIILVLFLSLLFTTIVKKRVEFENQLINSERELRLANKTKDKFISILAHDLKNPIASITGFTEIIKTDYESMSPRGRDKIFGAMESATQILIRLIDDVLTWARSQSGSIVVDKEIVFINKVIEDAIKISGLQAAKKDIKLVREYTKEYFAIADQQMIETVLRNLIGNAIKFSHRGSDVKVGIEFSSKNNMVVVSVKDMGIGISYIDKKKLFSLENLKTSPGTENESGTGMGLILCDDFVKKNGGEIWVESQEKSGTTFFFSLPAYLEDE